MSTIINFRPESYFFIVFAFFNSGCSLLGQMDEPAKSDWLTPIFMGGGSVLHFAIVCYAGYLLRALYFLRKTKSITKAIKSSKKSRLP